MFGHNKNLRNYNTASPTPEAILDELFKLEVENAKFHYPYEIESDELLEEEIRDAIQSAFIAFYDHPMTRDTHEFLLVVWEYPQKYSLYTWIGGSWLLGKGKLKVVEQNQEWFNERYPFHNDPHLDGDFRL